MFMRASPRHKSKVREYLASVIKHRCIINVGQSNSLYKLEHGSRKKLDLSRKILFRDHRAFSPLRYLVFSLSKKYWFAARFW